MFSALPPEADIGHARWDVRVVPPPDSCTAAKYPFRPLESEVLQDFFRPNLPTQQFCRAGLRPSGRGGGGISRGSIVRPGAALSRPGTAAGYRAEQPPGDIEAPRAAAAALASLQP